MIQRVEVMEQKEATHTGGQETLTELQADLREQRQIEDKQADREPQVRMEPI